MEDETANLSDGGHTTEEEKQQQLAMGALPPAESKETHTSGDTTGGEQPPSSPPGTAPPTSIVVDLDSMKDAVFYLFPDRNQRLSKFWMLIILSSIIASAGVANDSTATVIGAMIVGTYVDYCSLLY